MGADEFAAYEAMKGEGVDCSRVYARALADGLDRVTAFRMLRAVFGFSVAQAKEAIAIADGGESLDVAQAELVAPLRQAVDESDD